MPHLHHRFIRAVVEYLDPIRSLVAAGEGRLALTMPLLYAKFFVKIYVDEPFIVQPSLTLFTMMHKDPHAGR
ncbi:MAG TPA: hypothetical protein PK843_07975 [bacterium]|nr:hypothetical protein [bacterium]HPN34435.1 hypothetical protein [bacterium]